MPNGDALAAEARSWCGTPFHWGGSVKGVGCDCKGLLAGVARECGRPEAQSFEALYIGYGRKSEPAKLAAGMARLFDQVPDPQPGDVLLISITGEPRHLAIYVGDGRMVHSYIAKRRVMAVPLTGWTIDSIWRWRDG